MSDRTYHQVVHTPKINDAQGNHQQVIPSGQGNSCRVPQKVSIGAVAHTVTDPRAMMVHSQNASSTHTAVMRAWRLECAAMVAVPLVAAMSRRRPAHGHTTSVSSEAVIVRHIHVDDQEVVHSEHTEQLAGRERGRLTEVRPHDKDLRRDMQEYHEHYHRHDPACESMLRTSTLPMDEAARADERAAQARGTHQRYAPRSSVHTCRRVPPKKAGTIPMPRPPPARLVRPSSCANRAGRRQRPTRVPPHTSTSYLRGGLAGRLGSLAREHSSKAAGVAHTRHDRYRGCRRIRGRP